MNKLVLGLVLSSITVTESALIAQATPQLTAVAHKSSSPVCSVTKSGHTSCGSNVISQLAPSTDNEFVCPPDQPDGYVRCNAIVPVSNAHVCPLVPPIGYVRCHSMVVVRSPGTPFSGNLPIGYSPSQFLTAYQLTDAAKNLTNTTIAIVDAYNSPTIEDDLKVYSQTYNLPACTTANGCFKKVNQRGEQNNLPRTDSSWALEIALDVEIAHGICPNCKILLVEADSNSYNDMGLAVKQAVKLGANVVSNSYGSDEYKKETYYDPYYNYSGVAIVASSGDTGYGVQYPAASPYVTAVGGTTLVLNQDNTRNTETAWNGSGSGCSAFEPKPKWQPDKGCKNRTVVDVAADADPSTGAAIYNSTPSPYGQGWFTLGGTGLSAPIIAGVYAIAGNSSSINATSRIYTNSAMPYLYRVTSGANGYCNIPYLCNASYGYTQYGYNGPTGFGTPIGPNAF